MSERERALLVSVVVVLPSDRSDTFSRIQELSDCLMTLFDDYEIVLVANARRSSLVDIDKILAVVPAIRLTELARECDFDTAAFAGIDSAIGERICLYDPWSVSMRDLVSVLAESRRFDIIQGVSTSEVRSRKIRWKLRKAFYAYGRRALRIEIPVGATYLQCWSRSAVGVVSRVRSGKRYLRQEARMSSAKYTTYKYAPMEDSLGKRSLREELGEAFGIVTTYSLSPLRTVSWIAVGSGALSLSYVLYVLLVNLLQNNVVPGWTTTSLLLAFIFLVLAILLAIIAEYIGTILASLKSGPGYQVISERTSTGAGPNAHRRNVAQ